MVRRQGTCELCSVNGPVVVRLGQVLCESCEKWAAGPRRRCARCNQPKIGLYPALCENCAEGQRRKPNEYWAKISRYKTRPGLTCIACAKRITGAEEYYTKNPSYPIKLRVAKCVECHETTNYTDDDNRRELARQGAQAWRMEHNRGTSTWECNAITCLHWIQPGEDYWRMLAGSVERPIPMYHCKRHTAANGDHDINLPKEAPAGKIGRRRVGMLPEN